LHDRILRGTGRVAQAHVLLDRSLRNLLQTLDLPDRVVRELRDQHDLPEELVAAMIGAAGPPLSLADTSTTSSGNGPGWNFKKLVKACQHKVNLVISDERFRQAARDALRTALDANELRDRVVHDMWIERPIEPSSSAANGSQLERWQTVPKTSRIKIHTTDLSYIGKAEEAVIRSTVRVMELQHYVGYLMTGPPPAHWPTEATPDLTALLAVIQGNFELLPNGGYRPLPTASDIGPS
jgi:hypothetical protein